MSFTGGKLLFCSKTLYPDGGEVHTQKHLAILLVLLPALQNPQSTWVVFPPLVYLPTILHTPRFLLLREAWGVTGCLQSLCCFGWDDIVCG